MMFKVLIIGLGQVGSEYDYSNTINDVVLSHARAFSVHPQFELVGGVDSSQKQCARFSEKYNCPAGDDLETMLKAGAPDVVVVSSSTDSHAPIVRTVLEFSSPKAILCEKPLSYRLQAAQEMVNSCAEKECKLFVNFLRRAEPSVREVKRRLLQGEVKTPVKGVTWYTKGLLHNGAHFVDLLEFWLGKADSFYIIAPGAASEDLDVEPDVQINFEKGTVTLLAAQKENYSFHEVDLIAPNGRLRCLQGGARIVWQRAEQDPVFENYTVLSSVEEEIPSESYRTQWHVADQLAIELNGGDSSLCRGENALQTLEFLMNIRAAV
ncbi:Gfo/Idh/MocA family protein [Kiloniella sp.]|uniref:Gfo/Idh/MocA family protein n=1 Tax=Kiloniella sp. TaxID=1938587 RepID=UPI003B02B1CC